MIASDTISTSGGIRDPHILRGEDGCYYMVATDMFTMRSGWIENPLQGVREPSERIDAHDGAALKQCIEQGVVFCYAVVLAPAQTIS